MSGTRISGDLCYYYRFNKNNKGKDDDKQGGNEK